MDETPSTQSSDQDVRRQQPPEEDRPDLTAAPENPPVDQPDLERGQAKLERVIAK